MCVHVYPLVVALHVAVLLAQFGTSRPKTLILAHFWTSDLRNRRRKVQNFVPGTHVLVLSVSPWNSHTTLALYEVLCMQNMSLIWSKLTELESIKVFELSVKPPVWGGGPNNMMRSNFGSFIQIQLKLSGSEGDYKGFLHTKFQLNLNKTHKVMAKTGFLTLDQKIDPSKHPSDPNKYFLQLKYLHLFCMRASSLVW